MAGMTIRVSSVDEAMPPTMGAAMRRMTSEPVPLLHRMGKRSAMMVGAVWRLSPEAVGSQSAAKLRVGSGGKVPSCEGIAAIASTRFDLSQAGIAFESDGDRPRGHDEFLSLRVVGSEDM